MTFHLVSKGKYGFHTYRFDLMLDGVRHRKRVKALPSQIYLVYAEWEKALRLNKTEQDVKLETLFNKYLNFCQENKTPEEAIKVKTYVGFFNAFFKGKRVSNLTLESIDDFVKALNRKYPNANTYNRALNVIKTFMAFGQERGYPVSPKLVSGRSRRAAKREMVLLNEEQIRSLLSSCKQEYQRTFIMLAIFTGMRHSEILSLKWSDVFLKERFIKLRAETTKAKKARIIPLIPLLLKYLFSIKKECDHVVCYMGKRIYKFKKSWGLITKKAKLSGLRIHDLRHHFITLLTTSGVANRYIQMIVGHSDLAMTEHYSNLSTGHIEKVAGEISRKVKLDVIPE